MRRGGGESGWVWAAVGLLATGLLAGCVDDFPAVGPVGSGPADLGADGQADVGNPPDMRPVVDGAPGDAVVPDQGACAPVGETCNGLDDDCDGRVDEQQPRQPCALTAGVCAGDAASCLNGTYAACDHGLANANYEMTETRCDGLDNDCDGNTDEGCACTPGETQPCGLDVGACQPGMQRCEAGSFGACEGAFEGGPEDCNGEDDDCDAETDEDVPPTDCETGRAGVCNDGEQACVQACVSLVEPADEVCDGRDNDCDGTTDEGIEPERCLIDPDRPACGMGETRCVDGAVECLDFQDRLDATCDGMDDDCDGRVDENFVEGAPCREAACEGTSTCENGQMGCALMRTGNIDLGPDGTDDDCDGAIDEGRLTLYLEDLMMGGTGARPGVARGYLPGYPELSVRDTIAFDPDASPVDAVDWLFRPDPDGSVVITSTNLAFDFSANVGSGLSWTPPAKGPFNFVTDPLPPDGRPHVIEMHANIGITFDLNVLRARYPGRDVERLAGRFGSSDRGRVRLRTLVDGDSVHLTACIARINPSTARMETIPEQRLGQARFLSFAALDCGENNIGNKHGFLNDVRIQLSPLP